MPLCPSKVQLHTTSFRKPFPALLEKAGYLCPQQPALSLESTSPALLWLMWLSIFPAPRGLCHCTSGTQKNVLMSQRLKGKVMPVYVTGQCALPGGPLLVLQHHHISVMFQSLRQPQLQTEYSPSQERSITIYIPTEQPFWRNCKGLWNVFICKLKSYLVM